VLPVFLFSERSSVEQEPPGRVRGGSLYGRRRSIAEGPVRPDVVVVVTPGGDDRACVVEAREPVLAETLLAKLPVEAYASGDPIPAAT